MPEADGFVYQEYFFVAPPQTLQAVACDCIIIGAYNPSSHQGCLAAGNYISHEREREVKALGPVDHIRPEVRKGLMDMLRDSNIINDIHLPHMCRDVKQNIGQGLRLYVRGGPLVTPDFVGDALKREKQKIEAQRMLVASTLSREFPGTSIDYGWAPDNHYFKVNFQPGAPEKEVFRTETHPIPS